MRLVLRRTPDSEDSPPYLSQLKLHTPPFSSNTGGALFYADAQRSESLDMLQQLTWKGGQPLLVVGDKGLGKSTLINKYLERVEDEWYVCRIAAAQGIDLATLTNRVSECFAPEMGRVEPAQLLDALRQHLNVLLGMQLSVLVIDDAHALTDEVLEAVLQLAALQGEGRKLIQVLLFAEGSIDRRLQLPRFASIATPYRIELKPLQEWDSAVYLLHRLQQSGLSGDSPFSAAEMKQLYRKARGIPAQLNHGAHELLLARSKQRGLFSGLTRSALRNGLVACALMALITLVLVMHERINVALAGDRQSGPELAAESPPLHPESRDRPAIVAAENSQGGCGGLAYEEDCSTPAESPPQHFIKLVETTTEPKAEAGIADRAGVTAQQSVTTVTDLPAKKAVEQTAVTRVRLEGSRWIAVQPAGNFTLQLLASIEPRAVDEFVAEHAALGGPLASFAQLRDGKRMNVVILGSYASREEAEVAARELPDKLQSWIRDFAGIKQVIETPASPIAPAELKISAVLKDTAWVWSQNPNHYTIQLEGASDEASIEVVMRGLNLPGDLAVVQTLRDGKPWFALIYGRFADKAAAQGTADRLPAPLKKAGPWIRQFSALQDEIGRATAH